MKMRRRGHILSGLESAIRNPQIRSGAPSVRVMDDSTQARACVKLETASGRRLWGRDFGHKMIFNPSKRREPTKRRAVEVAEGLRRDWEKSK